MKFDITEAQARVQNHTVVNNMWWEAWWNGQLVSPPKLNEVIESWQVTSSSPHMAADQGHSSAVSVAHMTDTKTENINESSKDKRGSNFFCVNLISYK